MKIIFAATPVGGHVNPLVGTARLLVQSGHDVVFYTGTTLRDAVERTGARLHPLPKEVDFDFRDVDRNFPERGKCAPGVDLTLYDFKNFFIGPMETQHRGLEALLADFQADAIIYEHLFYGVVPMLFKPDHRRPAMIGCGITFLSTPRQDRAPHGPGLPFTTEEAVRQIYANDVAPAAAAAVEPLQALYDSLLAGLGLTGHKTHFSNATTLLADDFWQTTVPGFEYPQDAFSSNVTFVGAMPQVASTTPLPLWAEEVADFKRVVLVTQGTVANEDFNALVKPTLAALADEEDTLVLVTAGGRDIADLNFDLPINARIASYLPFDWLLPRIDLLITNGGYGTVNQALAAGVPIIAAGSTEDKPEVAARIAWSGVGINLETARPKQDAVKDAYRRIFADDSFRSRAREMAAQFKQLDSAAIIQESLRLFTECNETELGRRKAS
jgi:MGT family glycosyltransferase